MIIQIFKPPDNGETLMACKLGDISDAISLEYEEYFCGVGTFTLELPVTSAYLDKIQVNTLLYSREDDICWIVKNIKDNMQTVTVTGYDLKGLLLDRLTMAAENPIAGTEGKDAVSGTTEACVKHYVEYNLVSSVVAERNIPRLACADDAGRGIAADSYLAAYSSVDDVVRTMCEGAKLGYKITFAADSTSDTEPLFIFEVAEQVDRTAEQSERNRAIFSVGWRNINGMEREYGITAEKNAIWCETGGLDGFVYDADVPSSWNRREEYLSLSVTDPYNSEEITSAVSKERADKFAETDSLTADAGNPLDYRVLYNLGDIVTVYDADRKLQLNTPISAVKVKRTASEHTVKLIFGETKPKLLDSYAKKNQLVSRNQRDFPAASVSSSSATTPLTSYSILSDSSVQCNGRRYDIETDSTGLISRIADDLGGVLVPENVAAPADLALHNAVLWAVAISKGLASPQPSGEYVYICTDYDAEKKLWTNQSGAPPLDLSAALVNSDGIHGNVWWTVPVIPNPLGQFTFYAVARAADFDNLTGNWMNVIANEGATPQYNLTVRHKKWSIGTDEDTGYHWGDTYATEWRVLAVRRNGAVGEFYVDDSLQHSLSYCHPQIGDVDENFQINGVDFKFRYIGIFNEYHDDATLKAKIAELQQTYYTELPAVNDWKLLQSSPSGSYKTSETLSGAIPHSDTGYAMLVVSTRYADITLTDNSWELLTQSAITNEGVEGLAKQSFFVYIKPLSEFDGSDYSVTVGATRFIWASLSYFTDAAKISVAHTSTLSAQSWVTPAKTEPTKRLYLVTVTHEVTPSLQSAVDGTSVSYIARTNTTRALMAYDYKPDMMSPLNIDTADSTSGQNCRAVLALDIE